MAYILNINDLPPEKLPNFWNDNARINSLYAPFRDRSVNARDWDAKLHFWTSLINTWANYNHVGTFTEAELKKWFIKNGRVPACISVVMSEMHKNQELQTLDKFMEMPQKTWTGWAVDITIKRPLKWSFNKVKSTFVVPTDANTKFVHVPTIKNISEQILKNFDVSHRNKLITLDDLISATNTNNVEIDTINLVLHYLKCEDKIDMIENPDNSNEVSHDKPMLIKMCLQNSTKVSPINEIDISTYKLESNEKKLLKMIENLEHEKTQVTKNAKAYVAKGMRQMAKNCLRKQHELERRIEKQANVLDNVQILLTRIGTAESDTKVLESYKSGLNALKSVFKENGITEDSVSDTMLDMADTLETHDDIQSSMSQSVVTINDAELEDELNELLNEDNSGPPSHPTSPGGTKKKDESYDDIAQRLKNLNLPSVPLDTPSSSPIKNLEFS